MTSNGEREPILIGVIGGSGLYEMKGMKIVEELAIETPFGMPSDAFIIGELETASGPRRVAFLPRHGRGHRHNPTQVPARANIWAFKKLGVFWLISVSAVGSLREEIAPRDFVVPDQVIDRTRSRENTFFDEIAVHAGFSHPFHPDLATILADSAQKAGLKVHKGGTYVCMEGPLFSTQAESAMHRSWGASVIGMTALPEAKLAREAEMCYACIALATDYDVWREGEEIVSIEHILANIKANVSNAQQVIAASVAAIPLGREAECEAYSALKYAIMTRTDLIPESTRSNLGIILDKYLGEGRR
jgi:5'-methylthioadenosine phosphorylase